MSNATELMRALGVDDWADEADNFLSSSDKEASSTSWNGSPLYTGSIYGVALSSDNYEDALRSIESVSGGILFISPIGEPLPGYTGVFLNEAESIVELLQGASSAFSCLVVAPASSLTADGGDSLSCAYSVLRSGWLKKPSAPPLIILDPDMREGYSEARHVLPRFCDRMLFLKP